LRRAYVAFTTAHAYGGTECLECARRGRNPNFKVAVDQLALTKPQDWARTGIPNGDQIIGDGVLRFVVKSDPVDQALKDTAARLEKEGAPIIKQTEERLKQG